MKPKYKTIYENSIRNLFRLYGNGEISSKTFEELLITVCNEYRKERKKYGN